MIHWVLSGKLAFADMDEGCGVRGTANIHACKTPCFMAVTPAQGKPWPLQPTWVEDGHNLYLNMIDPDRPLFRLAMFEQYMAFVDRNIRERPVIVHCKQGRSRSPSLVLLWLAKRTAIIPNSSYAEAAETFAARFPYLPRAGIVSWLRDNWTKIT